METENKLLMSQARAALTGKWGLAVGVILLFYVITYATSFALTFVGGFIFGEGAMSAVFAQVIVRIIDAPFFIGVALFSLNISRNNVAGVKDLFAAFKRFGTIFYTSLLVSVLVLLWSLLLIIPGIIAAYAYSQTFFILADDASITPLEAIRRSKKMMMGYKLKCAYLSFRFIGWGLLSLCTFGIGFLWLIPYMQVSLAKFYDDVKNNGIDVAQEVEPSTGLSDETQAVQE